MASICFGLNVLTNWRYGMDEYAGLADLYL